MSQRIENLDEIYVKVWDLLQQGAESGKSDFHFTYLSTIAGKYPRVRTVVLRKVLRENRALLIHTDKRSSKVEEIENNKFVSLLFYSKDDKIQIRIEGEAIIHNDGYLFEKQWSESKPLSRRCYLIEPGPGASVKEPISGIPEELKDRAPTEAETGPGKENFRVIEIHAKFIEWLNLHSEGHIRAKFDLDKNSYQAGWLIP